MYVSAIANTTKGTLYASVEKGQPGGAIVGMTSAVATDAGSTPAPTLDLAKLDCKRVA